MGRSGKIRIFTTRLETNILNIVDLIVCLILALAVWNGWRQGLIVQVCSLAGIVAGIWLAARFGAEVGAWLRLDEEVAAAGGFVTVLVAVVAGCGQVAARLLRKLFHFAGFGIADIVLGVAVSVVKYLLVLSVLVAAFDRLNADYTLADRQTIGQSRSYGPLLRLSEMLPPLLEEVSDRLPRTDAAAATEAPGAEKTDENDG